MPWSILLDFLMAILLAVTIGYAVILNRRLVDLRRQRAELEGGISGFHQAIKRAEDCVRQLKISTDGLQDRVDGAGTIQSDLAFLVERGETAADRLEASIRAARGHDTAAKARRPAEGRRASSPARAADGPRSETECELLKALASGD